MRKIAVKGRFEVGQAVQPKDTKGYGGNRRGTVVEVTPTRVRVLWEKHANGVAGKRTWMQPERLAHAEQPAVGPGGWVLDTNE